MIRVLEWPKRAGSSMKWLDRRVYYSKSTGNCSEHFAQSDFVAYQARFNSKLLKYGPKWLESRRTGLNQATRCSKVVHTVPTAPDLVVEGSIWAKQESASIGRRGMLSVTAIPFFLNLQESLVGLRANAAEDYFLVKEEVKKVLSKGKAAGVLRLVFHDAGTFEIEENAGGMNGSIVFELDRPENTGLKKPLKILEKAKAEVDMIQPVSWADMIAVAGAEAVSVCGGPNIPVQLGRIDSMVPDPEGKLPQESLDASSLKQCFQRKGFSTQELVALSGAHTLGSKGFGNPTAFDNSYFKILLEKPWSSSAGMSSMMGLPTDRALVEDDECLRWISMYANDQDLFFQDFRNVYIKLVNTGAAWKPSL